MKVRDLMIMLLALSFCAVSCQKTGPTGPTPPSGQGYSYYCAGSPADAVTAFSPGYVLMGGGSDVDEAFRWMIQRSGGGDFVVIRASGADAYNSYVASLGQVDSVETLTVHSRTGANDQFVVSKVRNAEALFIAGGDQADYLRLWKGTGLNEAVDYAIGRGVPVGGTSAGLAVLGEFVFSALNGTVYSPEALANPYNSYITLDRNFLAVPVLQAVIADSHFASRKRMGRLLVFMARVIKDGWAGEVKGIGIDEDTALLVETNGTAQPVGLGAAYFLLADHVPEVCQPSTPLTYSHVPVYKIQAGGTFNLLTWQGSGGELYYLSVTNGIISSSTGSVY
ncbi:MAG: cyanophycinase [Candidatus Aminicenantes bacterium]|nr:cyanophycinase [Candidatus Aminicenantes bacterium]